MRCLFWTILQSGTPHGTYFRKIKSFKQLAYNIYDCYIFSAFDITWGNTGGGQLLGGHWADTAAKMQANAMI